jgi:predicted GIY-YIG superfamily endonuclease
MTRRWYVYVVRLTGGRWYVGQTTYPASRFLRHCSSEAPFQLFGGFRPIDFEIVQICSTWRETCDAEARWAESLRRDGRLVVNSPRTFHEARRRAPSPSRIAAREVHETETERLTRWVVESMSDDGCVPHGAPSPRKQWENSRPVPSRDRERRMHE